VVVGGILAIGFRHFHGPGMTNALAGFLLGLLLLGIGIAAVLLAGQQTTVVDPHTRTIFIKETSLLKTTQRTIPFDEIVEIAIGYLGKRSNGVTFYYLILKLRTGKEYPLFAAGYFYDGGSDRSVVEGWRQRLEEYLRSAKTTC
jgi:hypothetical protein